MNDQVYWGTILTSLGFICFGAGLWFSPFIGEHDSWIKKFTGIYFGGLGVAFGITGQFLVMIGHL